MRVLAKMLLLTCLLGAGVVDAEPQNNQLALYVDAGSTGFAFSSFVYNGEEKTWEKWTDELKTKEEKDMGSQRWYHFWKRFGGKKCYHYRYTFGYTDAESALEKDGFKNLAECNNLCVKKKNGDKDFESDFIESSNSEKCPPEFSLTGAEACTFVKNLFWGDVKNMLDEKVWAPKRKDKKQCIATGNTIKTYFTGGMRDCQALLGKVKGNIDGADKLVEMYSTELKKLWGDRLTVKSSVVSPTLEGDMAVWGLRNGAVKILDDVKLLIEFGGSSIEFAAASGIEHVDEQGVTFIRHKLCGDTSDKKKEKPIHYVCRIGCKNEKEENTSNPPMPEIPNDDVGLATSRPDLKFNLDACMKRVEKIVADYDTEYGVESLNNIIQKIKTQLSDNNDKIYLTMLPWAVVSNMAIFKFNDWLKDWDNIVELLRKVFNGKSDAGNDPPMVNKCQCPWNMDFKNMNGPSDIKVITLPEDKKKNPLGLKKGDKIPCRFLCEEIYGKLESDEVAVKDDKGEDTGKKQQVWKVTGGITNRGNGVKIAVVAVILQKLGVLDADLKSKQTLVFGKGGWLDGCIENDQFMMKDVAALKSTSLVKDDKKKLSDFRPWYTCDMNEKTVEQQIKAKKDAKDAKKTDAQLRTMFLDLLEKEKKVEDKDQDEGDDDGDKKKKPSAASSIGLFFVYALLFGGVVFW